MERALAVRREQRRHLHNVPPAARSFDQERIGTSRRRDVVPVSPARRGSVRWCSEERGTIDEGIPGPAGLIRATFRRGVFILRRHSYNAANAWRYAELVAGKETVEQIIRDRPALDAALLVHRHFVAGHRRTPRRTISP